MMIGTLNHHPNPTVHVPPWTFFDDLTIDTAFPSAVGGVSVDRKRTSDEFSQLNALTKLHQYLPSDDGDVDSDGLGGDFDLNKDIYSCDQFRMFEFKIRKCTRALSHDWTECPYSHPGEKARRRDPRKFQYSGTACPDFRKENCKKGDACEYAHGVFECLLHPSRYRTQLCKDGLNCRRRVCFFAHSPEQLRVLSPGLSPGPVESYDGSPKRLALDSSSRRGLCFMTSPQSESPSMSDSHNLALGSNYVSEMIASLRRLQLNKVKSMPSSRGLQMGLGSPRLPMPRPFFSSLPSTPTGIMTRKGIRSFDRFEGDGSEEEPLMERVESGRDLRAKMFEKLSRENPLDGVGPSRASPSPDVGWVSELVK